ncbi:hypothetical protein [Actinokineospora cianjurensis]|uniref:hypothetical protein n=1 Tax=Actinokineospora cianjurensis TaxID=585224 RepID=UPI000EAB7A24|nr:hypothetical protein [Actinokineospora cianjurensis]
MDREERLARARAEVAAACKADGKPGFLARLLRGTWQVIAKVGRFLLELAGEAVFEVLVAVLAIGLFVGVIALVAWGFAVNPIATTVLVAGLAVFLVFGVLDLIGGRRPGRLGAILTGTGVFTVIWLGYVFAYL